MLSHVSYQDHRTRILPLIEKSAKRNRHDFASNVDNALLSGRAFLFVSGDGFVVLEPFDGDKVCIAFAYSFTGHATEKYQPELEKLTRLIGGKYLVFTTTLRGFAILARNLGYKKSNQVERVTTWIKEVP